MSTTPLSTAVSGRPEPVRSETANTDGLQADADCIDLPVRRQLGGWEGKVRIGEDFDDPLPGADRQWRLSHFSLFRAKT